MREIKFRQFIDGKMKFSGMIFIDGSFSIPDLKTHKHPLEQFTGLTDKNGKEIYEGDIIDDSYISPLSNEKIEKKYVVRFKEGCFWAEMIPSHPFGSTYLNFKGKESIVIGNIHENPELI